MAQQKDLILTAGFDDQTQKFFDQLNSNFNDAKGEAADTNQAMSQGSKKSAASLGIIAGAVGGITSALVQMALQAASAFPALISESTKLAAAAETSQVALEVVAENAGISAEEIARIQKEMVNMGIATGTANSVLLKFIGNQLDISKVTDLARASLDAATVAGISEEEHLSRVTHGFVTKNTAVINDLGLSIQAETAYEAQAQALGKLASQLTETEKKNALLSAGLQDMVRFEGARTKAMGTAGKQMSNMDELSTNLKTSFGQLFLPAYTEWVKFLADGMAKLQMWFTTNEDAIEGTARVLGVFVGWLIDAGAAAIKFLTDFVPIIRIFKELPSLVGKSGIALAGLFVGQEEANERFKKLGDTIKQVMVIMTRLVVAGVEGLKALATASKLTIEALKPIATKKFWEWTEQDFAKVKDNLSAVEVEFGKLVLGAQDAGNAAARDLMSKLGMLPEGAKKVKTVTDEVKDLTAELAEGAKK